MPSPSDQQLEELLSFIVDPKEREEVQSFIAEHPELRGKILESFERKKEIFRRGDKAALAKLLDEERAMIASV